MFLDQQQEVTKTATCKRCKSTSVTWQKSRKTGKFYLTEVFSDPRGGDITGRTTFHSKFCAKPEDHARVQAEIMADYKRDSDKRESDIEDAKRERERVEAEAEFTLISRAESDPAWARAELDSIERKLANYDAYPPTMDYMVEFGKAIAEIKSLKAQRELLCAALGLPVPLPV